MKKIFSEDLHWKGKLLVFTWHFKEEFDKINKPIDFVIGILEKGNHILVSKNQKKFNVYYPYKAKFLCLSYAMHENIIMIHIKPISNITEGKRK